MRCQDVQELFGEYWDLPDNDIKRLQVDAHIRKCRVCAEEFKIWQASADWIQSARPVAEQALPPKRPVSASVMDRIYQDESWRLPINKKAYALSLRLRRNVTGLIAVFLLIFLYTAVHGMLLTDHSAQHADTISGIMPTASADAARAGAAGMFESIPVASIGAPSVLSLEQFPHYPNYWLALSLIGVISTLLIMNWLSRLKA